MPALRSDPAHYWGSQPLLRLVAALGTEMLLPKESLLQQGSDLQDSVHLAKRPCCPQTTQRVHVRLCSHLWDLPRHWESLSEKARRWPWTTSCYHDHFMKGIWECWWPDTPIQHKCGCHYLGYAVLTWTAWKGPAGTGVAPEHLCDLDMIWYDIYAIWDMRYDRYDMRWDDMRWHETIWDDMRQYDTIYHVISRGAGQPTSSSQPGSWSDTAPRSENYTGWPGEGTRIQASLQAAGALDPCHVLVGWNDPQPHDSQPCVGKQVSWSIQATRWEGRTWLSRYLAKDSSDIQRAFGSSKSSRKRPGLTQTCLSGNPFGPKPEPCTPCQHPRTEDALAHLSTLTWVNTTQQPAGASRNRKTWVYCLQLVIKPAT